MAGNYPEAIVSYQKALQLTPTDGGIYYEIGIASYSQKKYAEAERAYREAIRLTPTNANAHYNLGRTLDAVNRADEAVISFQEAVRLKPNPCLRIGESAIITSAKSVMRTQSFRIKPRSALTRETRMPSSGWEILITTMPNTRNRCPIIKIPSNSNRRGKLPIFIWAITTVC